MKKKLRPTCFAQAGFFISLTKLYYYFPSFSNSLKNIRNAFLDEISCSSTIHHKTKKSLFQAILLANSLDIRAPNQFLAFLGLPPKPAQRRTLDPTSVQLRTQFFLERRLSTLTHFFRYQSHSLH